MAPSDCEAFNDLYGTTWWPEPQWQTRFLGVARARSVARKIGLELGSGL